MTLLLVNAAAMEALPIFLDRLLSPTAAIVLSVTAVLFFGEQSATFWHASLQAFPASLVTDFCSCVSWTPHCDCARSCCKGSCASTYWHWFFGKHAAAWRCHEALLRGALLMSGLAIAGEIIPQGALQQVWAADWGVLGMVRAHPAVGGWNHLLPHLKVLDYLLGSEHG